MLREGERYVMVFPRDAPRGYSWEVAKTDERMHEDRYELVADAEARVATVSACRPALGPAQQEMFG
jgi:hypothetical protein